MDVQLGSKIASEVSIFVNFSIFNHIFFLCTSPATTFSALTHCLLCRVASFNYGDSRARDVGPSVDHSEQLHDSISTCDVNKGYCMLWLFLFVLLFLCVYVCVYSFFFFFVFLFN